MIRLNAYISLFRRAIRHCILLALALVGSSCQQLSAVPAPQKPQQQQGPTPEQQFQLSDEELKALNLSETETEELRQFFSALNNLTPAQKQELEDLGRATEERMKEQGLDPNNVDDLMKFMQNEGLAEPAPKKPAPQEEPQRPTRPTPPAPKKMVEKPEILIVASSTDVKTMLNELLTHISSLRQKALTFPSMLDKLDTIQNEMAQLIFYLNVLRSPDLIKLVGSKDFVRLHGGIEKLRKSFISYEPSIMARKLSSAVNPDNPYHVLDLPESATIDALEKRFQELKAQQSPEAVEARAKAEGCEEKVCRHIRKSAERTFGLIQKAYDLLNDPKKRTEIDKELRETAAREARQDAVSMKAFENLFQALTAAFSLDQLLQQMNQLLEKHKPTELEHMKAQVELEKKVYERSKKRIIVPQVTPSTRPQTGDQFDSFYRGLGQKPVQPGRRPDVGRREQPTRPQQPGAPSQQQPGGSDKQPKAGDKGKDKGGDKDGKKSDDGKKDGSSKDKKSKDKSSKSSELSDDELKSIASIQNLGDLLDQAKKKEGKIEVTFDSLASPGQMMKEEQPLSRIMKRLELEFNVADKTEAAEHLQQFFDEHKLSDLVKSMKSAVPEKGKALSGQVAKQWASKVASHAPMIQEWYQKVAQPLTSAERQSGNIIGIRGDIPPNKKLHHGLNLPDEKDPWKKPKKDEKEVERDVEGVDLGLIRSQIKALNEFVTQTKAADDKAAA